MGIPYVALPYDKKITAFHKQYRNGIIVHNPEELTSTLNDIFNGNLTIKLNPIDIKNIYTFGERATKWVTRMIKS